MDYEIVVKTAANESAGPLTLEFPLSGNISYDLFTICSYKTTFVGRNLGCVNEKSFVKKDTMEAE